MCGIAGLWDVKHSLAAESAGDAVRRMTRALSHRGPDDEGYFQDPKQGLNLGHRRLSIVDLSPSGHQPMESPSRRYVIVFNGEVYNHRLLRAELEAVGYRFRGHSDTEAMLAAVENWGIEEATRRFIGMFAFAIWDRKCQELSLVRDRLGIKPLYYGWIGGRFTFGSELKALRVAPDFSLPVERRALALLMRHNYIPAPWSIYEGIYKLAPGSIMTLSHATVEAPARPSDLAKRTTVYWSASDVVTRGSCDRSTLQPLEACERLDSLLRDAVGLRMEADVPLGAFLSGGIDSSTVVALMQVQSSRPVKTFSIGFREDEFNEAHHAMAVARHLGTDHTELYVTETDAIRVIPSLAQIYDEPFSDVSQIPTLLVSGLARQEVTVSLSGDGGDELFGGYSRYTLTQKLWSKLSNLPEPVRRVIAASIDSAPGIWGAGLSALRPMLSQPWRMNNPRDKMERLAAFLRLGSIDELYLRLLSHWSPSDDLVLGVREPLTALNDPAQAVNLQNDIERMMYFDLITYLPDDILTKVDRASMAVSLEARVPLLDHRVVEFAWQLPFEMKVHGAEPKWMLRQLLLRYVPQELVDRPKQGFGVPIGVWLRGKLRDWAEALLDERRLAEEGYLAPDPIRRTWADHVSGKVNEQYRLWDVLMFQAWLEKESEVECGLDAPQRLGNLITERADSA